VIALLAGHGDMGKAERLESHEWELLLLALDLLQAEHVRPVRAHEALDQVEPEPH